MQMKLSKSKYPKCSQNTQNASTSHQTFKMQPSGAICNSSVQPAIPHYVSITGGSFMNPTPWLCTGCTCNVKLKAAYHHFAVKTREHPDQVVALQGNAVLHSIDDLLRVLNNVAAWQVRLHLRRSYTTSNGTIRIRS